MTLSPKVFVLAFAAVASAVVLASTSREPPVTAHVRTATSPLLGSWSLDTSRLPLPPEQRPRSVRFTFAEADGGKWTTTVDIVYASGEKIHAVSIAALDGTYAVIENSPEADHVALQRPTPNVLVMALQKGGVLVSTRIYTVMPDEQKLVETVVYPGSENPRVMRANYFGRDR